MNSLKIQSSDEAEISSDRAVSAKSTTVETVTFVDSQLVVEDTSYRKVPIVSSGTTEGTSLAKFLSRPTLIKTHTWTTSQTVGNVSVDAQIKPWKLLISDATIKKKLSNYAYMRAKLCLKFVINGTPFHYGAFMVSHEPNVGFRTSKIAQPSVVANDIRLATPYSQLPHILLYPADNASADLHLPFFVNRSWLCLTRPEDWEWMGTLYYFIASPLRVASATASTSLTIQTYAWFEDVELNGSTEFSLQGGDVSDACKTIANIGSTVAKATAFVAPEISAGATQLSEHASKGAIVAEALGYSNTPVTEDVKAYTPMPFSQMSTSEISTAVQKLVLSPTQGLSIDPALLGLGPEDEMVISHILQKPTILTVADWSTTELADTRIFGTPVSPSMFNLQTVGTPIKCYTVNHTYMSYLTSMFTYWRGDIIFDIDVICTKFHKGRLLLQWDPIGNPSAVAPINTVYSTVLDIGETNKATIRIPFHQRFEFLRARGITNQVWNTNNNDLDPAFDFDNGTFGIFILNPLVSPTTPATVDIIITVRGAENLELIDPCSQLGENAASVPPSFFPIQSNDSVDIESTEITLGDKGSFHPDRHLLNFGEPVVSLRALLHRYSMYDVSVPDLTSVKKFFRFVKSYHNMSPTFGFDPKGMMKATKVVGTGSAPYTCSNTHPMIYVAMLYGAYRGGTNFIVNTGEGVYSALVDTRVQRITTSHQGDFSLGKNYSDITDTDTKSTTLAWLNKQFTQYEGGATFTNDKVNPSLSFYLPTMNQYAFNFPDATSIIDGNQFDGSHRTCVLLDSIIRQTSANTSSSLATFTCYAGAGADFNCHYLLCCPTIFYYASYPVIVANP